MKQQLIFVLKGMLMGISDVIPGVSGGTIALIVGIYERLINGIKGCLPGPAFSFLKFLSTRQKKYWQQTKKEFLAIDFRFLIPLGIGIGSAFFAGSFIIPFLLTTYPAYIYAIFFGLILGSVYVLKNLLLHTKLSSWIMGIVGIIIAYLIVGMQQLNTTPTLPFFFLCGFIAISAMILPGISGSFMLLMLGQYQFMLESVRDLRFPYLISFGLGMIAGISIMVRILSYALKKFHSETIFFLMGLMIGALRLPVKNIVYVQKLNPQIGFVWGVPAYLGVVLCAILGLILVIYIGRFENGTQYR